MGKKVLKIQKYIYNSGVQNKENIDDNLLYEFSSSNHCKMFVTIV